VLLQRDTGLNRMSPHRGVIVDEIPIGIMLHIEAITALVPVIENLAAKDVTANTPRKLVTFVDKVLVS
jgi:hypothetical protein